jgi:hypothetical protein
MPYYQRYEDEQAKLRKPTRKQQLADQNRNFMEWLWSKPTKPRPTSIAEALFSSTRAKLLPDHQRGPVSRLGNVAGGWWGHTMSRSQVMKERKGK